MINFTENDRCVITIIGNTVIRIDILWQTSHSEYMSFDHLQMPATTGWISNRVGMTSLGSLLHILLCFQFVPPQESALRLFLFCQLIGQGRGHFCRLIVISFMKPNIFFQSENFCRTFGSGTLVFWLSDKFRQHCYIHILCPPSCLSSWKSTSSQHRDWIFEKCIYAY